MRCVVLAVLLACGERERDPVPQPPANPDELTAGERAQLRALSPLPAVPPDPTNKYADDPAAAKLGKLLFFDPALSGPLVIDSEHGKVGQRGRVSCASCHDGVAMDDRRIDPSHLSIGTGRGTRNSPPLVNAAHYRWANWAGRFDSQWSLTLVVIEKTEVMNGSRVDVARLIAERYRSEYEVAFATPPVLSDPRRFPSGAKPKPRPDAVDGPWEQMTDADRRAVDVVYVNAGKAVAAYLRLLNGRDAPFDRFVAGKADTIGVEATRGIKLFLAHCKVCHDGPHFTDNKFHALAVAQFGPDVPATDFGRETDLPSLLAHELNSVGAFSDARETGKLAGAQPGQRGQFRTPTLRNISATGPYMHAGQFKTLANVVAFYNAGGGEVPGIVKDPDIKPLRLSDREQADLVAFMKTLDDEPLPRELVAAPVTLDGQLDALRARDLKSAADIIAGRIAQIGPKMKLTLEQGLAAAGALLDQANQPAFRKLHEVMPRSTVELARAVRERGVTQGEAEAIARYLVDVLRELGFERSDTFDENHSHVIGRDWPDIDYTGERMTWQSQRDDWRPKGVESFKRAAFIHAYFVGAESLPHWRRVYRPRGKMADVTAP